MGKLNFETKYLFQPIIVKKDCLADQYLFTLSIRTDRPEQTV